jgi:hypothetical protein
MRRSGPLFLALLVAACSPTDAVSSSTVTSSRSTTSLPTTTSTTAATTTTTPSTTTTNPEPSTTLLEGNWADEPLIVTASAAIGWWDGSGWVDVDETVALPVSGGEDYQVTTLGPPQRTTGGAEALTCEPLSSPGVELEEPDLLGTWPGPFGVAISAPWELSPHLVEVFELDDGGYRGFASELLEARGLDVADPVIKQLLRVDLEGDGIKEVIVVAEDATLGFFPEPGDYSIVFMRKIVQGVVETMVLGESVAVDIEEGDLQYTFSIGAVADLNGDRQMEVVLDWYYYEGSGVEIWEYLDDDIGMVKALQGGCGA